MLAYVCSVFITYILKHPPHTLEQHLATFQKSRSLVPRLMLGKVSENSSIGIPTKKVSCLDA